MISTAIVIPGRLDSGRFPDKLMKRHTGRLLIDYVLATALQVVDAGWADEVIFTASDDDMGSIRHWYGTDEYDSTHWDRVIKRKSCGEFANGTHRIQSLNLRDHTLIINLQGDEPDIKATDIIRLIQAYPYFGYDIGTMVAENKTGRQREAPESQVRAWYNRVSAKVHWFGREGFSGWDHVGCYAFPRETLDQLIIRSGYSEKCSLEQLAWIEAGRNIRAVELDHNPMSINVPEDYDVWREFHDLGAATYEAERDS